MRGTTHAVIGANTVWIPVLCNVPVFPWFILIGAFAALLPDLDASESKIKHLSLSGYIGKMRIRIKPFAPLSMIFSRLFGHRGALHSLTVVVIVAVATSFLIPYTSVVTWYLFIFGYASHLVADACTRSGIELFWPFKNRFRFFPKILRIRTGGMVDSLLLILGTGGIIIFLYSTIDSIDSFF
ncbi:metal-dependent hydrolase [Patescibacteria group bacterium]